MDYKLLFNNELSGRFFKPLVELYSQSSHQYRCKDISDLCYAQLGVMRVASQAQSGHDFIQFLANLQFADIEVSHFFKALKSQRRLNNLTSLYKLRS